MGVGNAKGQNFGNGRAPAKPEPAVVMAAFDLLPPNVRACLRDAVFDWPTGLFLDRIHRGMSPEGAVEYVRDFERTNVQR